MDYSLASDRARLYAELARIGKVVMHPKRIELLELLCQGERSVELLAEAAGLKLTTASAHLQVMRHARLVETRRDGSRVYYRASSEEVCRFIVALGQLARARLAEVDRILRAAAEEGAGGSQEGSDVQRVTRAEFLDLVRSDSVVVLDVRPQEEYEAGHVPGALSLPLEHLEARLEDLDPTVEIVAYCRGPLCLLAPEAVRRLRARGRRARVLEDGMPEWRQAGLPVETGAPSEQSSTGAGGHGAARGGQHARGRVCQEGLGR
jgi:rhodanese-related sulfurtransferase/DNA-binding transcriptional ArsR family regulator